MIVPFYFIIGYIINRKMKTAKKKLKNLVKFTCCTGPHIRFIKKGGTKSEVFGKEKKGKGTFFGPFGLFFKNLIFKMKYYIIIMRWLPIYKSTQY
jgi:hypothetical protein